MRTHFLIASCYVLEINRLLLVVSVRGQLTGDLLTEHMSLGEIKLTPLVHNVFDVLLSTLDKSDN